jgi:hypothetical protein
VRLARLLPLAAVLVTPTAAAEARPFTIVAHGSATTFGEVRAIGDFRPVSDPTYAAALEVFGDPDAERPGFRGMSCRVSWHGQGLKIAFANFGGGSACNPDIGRSQFARAYGKRWRTARGLRVGDGARRLRDRYPRATRHGKLWWLLTAVSLIGETRRYPVVAATVRGARVRSFSVSIGAAGD